MTRLRAGAATDTGRVRTNNEDNLLVTESLFAVADGMGGHQGGEVASQVAIDTLRRGFGAAPTLDGLVEAVVQANSAIRHRSQSQPGLEGMGTTITAVALVPGSDGSEELVIVNVGDSRTYLLRHGELDQLTEDDSLVGRLVRDGQLDRDAARHHPQRNIITKALGLADELEVDPLQLTPVEGERLLLCSDGLTDEVTDGDISRVLRTVGDPEAAARQLVDLACEHGGGDNVTVVVVDVVDDGDRSEIASAALDGLGEHATNTSRMLSYEQRNAQLRDLDRDAAAPRAARAQEWRPPPPGEFGEVPSRRVTGRVVLFLLILLLVVGGAIAAVAFSARGSYFVGLEGDRVTIFKGRPGGLLWFQPTVEEATSVFAEDIRPARRDDLQAGKEQPSLEAARRYVANLEEEATPTTTSSTTTSTTTSPPA